MNTKQRLSASVDAELLDQVQAAVQQRQAATISAWVNDALRLKLLHERRLAALAAFVRDYESEHGSITEADMNRASRRARDRAVPVRGSTSRVKTARRRKGVA